MSLLEGLRMALDSLLVNKLRSGLTMLGIVIGVGAVIALMAVGAGAQAQVLERFESLGSNLLVIRPGRMLVRGVALGAATAQSLTTEDVEAIARLASTVAAIAPQYSVAGATVIYGNKNTQTTVVGVTPEYQKVGNWRLERGRFIEEIDVSSQAKVAVLGATVAKELFGEGFVDPLGKTIKINRQNYEVVGILASKGVGGFQNLDDQVFIPLSTAQVKFGGTGNKNLNAIYIQVVSTDKIDLAKAELTAILRAKHGLTSSQSDDFTILDQTQLIETVQETTQTFTVLLASIAAISLIVGGIGIMNIMLVSVVERTREIGIRKAVGAKQRDILLQFLLEAIVLSVGGGLIGILVGCGSAQLIAPLMGTDRALVTPSSIIMALSVSVAVGIFFGIYPANRAASLNPIEALRYE